MATVTPTYPQYTNLALNEGLFDQLMISIESHIQKEYDAQRIRGSDFSKVYLGALEAALGNSTQYLLGILLIDEKRDKLLADTALVVVETAKAQFELDVLMPLQAAKMEAEIELINAQIAKINKEIEFLTAKIATEVANVDSTGVDPASVIGRQTSLLLAQKLGFAGDIEAKTAKLHADYAAVFQSVQEVPEDVLLNADAQAGIALALTTAVTIKGA